MEWRPEDEKENMTHHKLDTSHAIPDAGQHRLLALRVPHAGHDDEGWLDSSFEKAIRSVRECYLIRMSRLSPPEQESHSHQTFEIMSSSATTDHNSPAQHAILVLVRASRKITYSSYFAERNFATGNF
jgi:hypothetical protein